MRFWILWKGCCTHCNQYTTIYLHCYVLLTSVQLTVHKSVSDQTVTNSYSWQLLLCSFRHSTITCNLKYDYRKACVRFLLVTYICVISGGHQELLGAVTPPCVYSLEIVHTAMEIKPVFWTLIVSTKRASLNLVLFTSSQTHRLPSTKRCLFFRHCLRQNSIVIVIGISVYFKKTESVECIQFPKFTSLRATCFLS